MRSIHPTRTLKYWLIATVVVLIAIATALLVWRTALYRNTSSHADNLHLRSVYLTTGIISNLALTRIAQIETADGSLAPEAYLQLADRELDQLKELAERFDDNRWRFLVTTLDTELYNLAISLSAGQQVTDRIKAAALAAEQLKRAHWIEYEEHMRILARAGHTDRLLLVLFALFVLLMTFVLANWLIDRLAEADRDRLTIIADLERKNDELSRFTYTVSHDLKSPLITVGGFAGLLDDDLGKGDLTAARQDANRIRGGINRMQRLLDGLLALSVGGKTVEDRNPVAMSALVNEVVATLREASAARQARIEIEPGLPVVRVDYDRMREALGNLLTNAVKFMGDQSEPLIQIGHRDSTEGPVFFVRDNGVGIEPDNLDRVFALFERLDADTAGTGIGLALTRRIIEAHGGRIWAESDGPGRGSTFFFTLGT